MAATKQITFRIDAEGNVDQVVSKAGNAFVKLGDDVGRASQAANSSHGAFGKIGSAIGSMGVVAGGIIAANVFGKIVEGLTSFASVGLSAVDSAQRLETGLGALLSMNNMYERITTTSTVAVEGFAEAQANAAEKSADLAFEQKELAADIKRQSAAIQEQRQRIIQMGEGLDKNEQVAKLEQMEIALEGLNRELAKTGVEQGKLSNIQQEYTTVTKTSFEQVMGLADAQKLAAAQSKDLLAYVEKLSIISPFEQDQVALVSKLAVAAGLGVEQTKSFTAGFLDLAAAVGIGSESLDFAADQLLQVAKVGKITSVDLRQLRRLGIDLEKIIGTQMGMSIEEFNEKAAASPEIFNDLFDSVTKFSQNTFAGTAEKMATSLSGLKSTFSDIFRVGAKNLMRPLIEAVGPAASQMLGKLSDIVTGPQLAKIGEAVPKTLFGAFKVLSGEKGALDIFTGLRDLGVDTETAKQITDITRNIRDLFETFQAGGVGGLAVALGIPPGIVNAITQTTTAIRDLVIFISEGENSFMAWLGLWDRFADLFGAETATKIMEISDSVMGLSNAFKDGFSQGGLIEGFVSLFSEIGTRISEALPGIAGQILTAIPAALTTVVDGVAAFFRDNWPTIMTTLNEWATKFWEWTNTALAGAGAALAGVLLAITAWATSPEAQTSLNNMGMELGKALQQGMTFLFENSGEAAVVLLKIIGALGAAVAVIAGDLIIIGGQIVAGMAAGMLEELGISVQPALVSELQGILIGLAENSMTIIREVAKKIVKGLADAFRAVFSAGMDVGDKFVEFMDSASDILTDPNAWLEIGEMAMQGLLKGITKHSALVLEHLKSLLGDWLSVFTGSEGLDEHSPSKTMMDIGKDAILGLQIGAENASGALNSSLKGITKGAIDTLMTGMTVNDAGFKDKFIDDLDMGGIAKAAGGGGSGWKEMRRVIHNAIKGNMHVLEGGGDEATIFGLIQREAARFNFPPNLAMEFAKAEGLVGHLKETFGNMWTAMRIENLKGSAGLVSQFASIGQGFADMIKEEMGMASGLREELNKLTGESDKLSKTQEDYQKKLVNLNADLLKLTQAENQDAEAIRRKQEAINELTLKIGENQAAIEANSQAAQKQRKELEAMAFSMFNSTDPTVASQTAMIDLLQEFMKGSQESLLIQADEASQAAGITGILYDRVSAQAELNRLLEEQQKRQEEILAIEKAQKDMAFLQQQISLLDMIRSKGLNPADILGGIQLGLGASASDLLTVTSNIVEAMVNQINEDLQISSPSKVMKRIGMRITEGLAQGVDSGQGLLTSTMNAVGGVVTSPLWEGPGGGATTNNKYNTVNMPVTINVTNPARRVSNDIMMLRARVMRN